MQKRFVTVITSISLSFLLLLPVTGHAEDDKGQSARVADGELLLPDDYDTGKEKKCLTVCEEWGEDCILNPATGSRKCRRVCKSFTEECF